MRHDPDTAPRARIPADVDTPDKIVYGLTARQLAILTVAAVIGFGIFRAVGDLLPQPVLIAVLTPLAGAAIVLALGRRDGLSMDAWLLAAIRQTRQPTRLAPAQLGRVSPTPDGAPDTAPPAAGVPMLRLPATAIAESGVIDTGSQAVALVACTTVNIGLRSGDEQLALIGAYGRWLNSLSGPVQIVISAQRVDLSSHAQRIADTAAGVANPALAEAAHDYAAFLDDLAARRDPLWRTVPPRCPANPARPAACCTASTPTPTASSGGTGGASTTPTRWCWPAAAPAKATSSNSKHCAPWPTGCTSP